MWEGRAAGEKGGQVVRGTWGTRLVRRGRLTVLAGRHPMPAPPHGIPGPRVRRWELEGFHTAHSGRGAGFPSLSPSTLATRRCACRCESAGLLQPVQMEGLWARGCLTYKSKPRKPRGRGVHEHGGLGRELGEEHK